MSYFHKPCDELERKLDNFFYAIEEINQRKYDNQITVILLGSLSRGEGTWDYDDKGNIRMLSDLEFFNIIPDDFCKRDEYESDVQEIINSTLSDIDSLLFHIDNSYTTYSELKKMERKILIFDAQEMGKTVVGKNRIKDLPCVTINNINFFDIRDILVHRVFSVLYYGLQMKRSSNINGYRYSLAKNSLDIMTVLLAQKRILVSGFANKLEWIKKIEDREEIVRFFDYCLKVKYGENIVDEFSVEEMESIFYELVIELSNRFKIPKSNTLKNKKAIFRRQLGVLKRSLKCRKICISQSKHLKRLLLDYNRGFISSMNIQNNYILNGYPDFKK